MVMRYINIFRLIPAFHLSTINEFIIRNLHTGFRISIVSENEITVIGLVYLIRVSLSLFFTKATRPIDVPRQSQWLVQLIREHNRGNRHTNLSCFQDFLSKFVYICKGSNISDYFSIITKIFDIANDIIFFLAHYRSNLSQNDNLFP